MINSDNGQQTELNISPAKVCDIISKARLFDAKVDPLDLEQPSQPIDEGDADVLEDSPDDPATAELREVIDDLDDEVVEV